MLPRVRRIPWVPRVTLPRRWGTAARPAPRTLSVIAVLLTFASGASDVTSFTRLGNVFTSVMTGNIAVFGLSLARGSVALALQTLMAVCGYVLGVAVGKRLVWLRSRSRAGPGPGLGLGPGPMTTGRRISG